VSRSFMVNLASRGVNPSKLYFIPNGVNAELWKTGDREAGRHQLGTGPGEVLVSYVGTIGMAHDCGLILDVAKQCQAAHPRLRFALVGDGAELATLRARADSEGLRNVTFTGLTAREFLPSVLAATDISLVTLKRSDVFKTVLPSKMFESMAAGRPIVLAVEGEARETLQRAGGGLAVQPGDASSMTTALVTLAGDADLRRALGEAGALFVEQEFSRQQWAADYLRLLDHARTAPVVAVAPSHEASRF
jgi:glycosyltransferase involved in cell wall biosynthesis